jgi:hypothetical protein
MIETPPVLFVSSDYASHNPHELDRHVRAGGIVAVLDLNRRKVKEWRSGQRPVCLDGWPDGLERIWQAKRDERSEIGRRTQERLSGSRVLSQRPGAVRMRRRNQATKGRS